MMGYANKFKLQCKKGWMLFILFTINLALSACGGGNSDQGLASPLTNSTPVITPVITPAIGATLVSTVARTGVAGTWGYTAPDGNRYAIMGTAKGVLVLDLRDPEKLRIVDEIDGPNNTRTAGIYWREMRVFGHYAYIVSEHTNVRGGIMILDLSGLPNSVRYVKSVVPHDKELAAHSVDIDIVRGLLYLQRETNEPGTGSLPIPKSVSQQSNSNLISAEAPVMSPPIEMDIVLAEKPQHPVGSIGEGSIEVWDIKTDPENPRYITTFNQRHSIHDMTAVGNYVYVAEGNESSYSIWDVKIPEKPQFLVRWKSGNNRFAHNIWPSGDESFVVTTDELPLGLPATVWKLDGVNPPKILSTFQIEGATPHNVIMEGNIAYLSHYTAGAAVYDLTNPSLPKLKAHVDTNSKNGNNLAGCWGVYKFPGQPWMICSDIDHGFNLIKLNE
jgi:choice-of-anchor B domain-containing protein